VGPEGRSVLADHGWDDVEKPVVDEALETAAISPTTPYRGGVARPPRHHIFPRGPEDRRDLIRKTGMSVVEVS